VSCIPHGTWSRLGESRAEQSVSSSRAEKRRDEWQCARACLLEALALQKLARVCVGVDVWVPVRLCACACASLSIVPLQRLCNDPLPIQRRSHTCQTLAKANRPPKCFSVSKHCHLSAFPGPVTLPPYLPRLTTAWLASAAPLCSTSIQATDPPASPRTVASEMGFRPIAYACSP
jgi:hypothetical protein